MLIKHMLYSDATDHLGKFHPSYVVDQKLPNYYMGKIDVSTFPDLRSRTKDAQDFRVMEEKMRKDGIFEPCYMYYTREIVKVAFLFAAAFYIVLSGPTSVNMVLFAAFLHAFGNQ